MKHFLTVLISIFLVGCSVKGPVSTSSTVDDRPQVTFDVGGYNPVKLEIVIDGLSYGAAAKYLSDEASLRLLPGKHRIEAYYQGQLIYSEQHTLGESTLSIIKVY